MQLHFVDGIDLTSEQIMQVAQLLLETGYYREVSKNNKFGLDAVALEGKISIRPTLNYIRGLFNENQTLLGFWRGMTRDQIIEVFNKDSECYYEEHPDVMQVSKTIHNLYTAQDVTDCLILHDVAIASSARGQGLFKYMLRDVVARAKNEQCQRVFALVWESKQNALAIYAQYGARHGEILDFSNSMFHDRLVCVIWEITGLERRLCISC